MSIFNYLGAFSIAPFLKRAKYTGSSPLFSYILTFPDVL